MGTKSGPLKYFRNTGSAFEEVVGDENPFKDVVVGNRSYPALEDLDADGDPDLVVGSETEIVYFRNEGSANAPDFKKMSGADDPFIEIEVA